VRAKQTNLVAAISADYVDAVHWPTDCC
jgi:hypothetical protein